MIEIKPSKLLIQSFVPIWNPLFLGNQNNLFDLYKKIHLLNSEQESLVKKDVLANCPFSFVYNRFCWENIILPIYVFNNFKINGPYKVLTNARIDTYHFVILDLKNNIIYDPTYEKAMDSELIDGKSCKGTACTLIQLGDTCYHFDLEYYFKDFVLVGEENLVEQVKLAGRRLLL